jgi:peptidoglycan/xylan/chitin deacetylase (PgdA/CDA1 family)
MIPPVPILLYHSVHEDLPGRSTPYAISRRRFLAHLDALTAFGFTTLTVSELLLARASGMPLPDRTAVITFDDGYADFAAYAWPAMADRGLAATLYVTAGRLDGTSTWLTPLGAAERPMLTRRQVVELAEAGCEIGAHSMTNPQLDCLPRSAAAQEIARSKKALEQLLGRPVDSFAYPHGQHDAGVRQLVVDSGFRSAVAVRDALSPAGDDWFALARVTVSADFDAQRLIAVMTAPSALGGRSAKRLGDQLWQQARRLQHRQATEPKVGA